LLLRVATRIFQQAQASPEPARDKFRHIAEEMARQSPSAASSPLTLHQAAELRGKPAAGEAVWNAPGMEV